MQLEKKIQRICEYNFDFVFYQGLEYHSQKVPTLAIDMFCSTNTQIIVIQEHLRRNISMLLISKLYDICIYLEHLTLNRLCMWLMTMYETLRRTKTLSEKLYNKTIIVAQ